MGFAPHIFLIGAVVCSAYGCAPALLDSPARLHANKLPANASASAASTADFLNPELSRLARAQDKQDFDLSLPLVLPALALPTLPVETKVERPAPAVKLEDTSPTALQKAPGPRADDQLLELLEKDLDKAVGQSAERRRLQFSKAVIDDPKVRHYVDYFSKSTRNHFAQLLARSGKYMPVIAKAMREAGLPDELGYLALIESGFVPQTTSPSGAVGLWQFVPATARRYGLRIDSWVDERRDPVKSSRAAAAYLKDLHDYYGRWFLATAAYNAGQGALDQALQKSKDKDYRSLGENPQLRAESRNFVPKFVAVALIAAEPRKYGFESLRYEAPLAYEEVEVRESMKLETVAIMTGSDLRALEELNPALLRSQTPPGKTGYRVYIPQGSGLLLAKGPVQKKESVEPAKEPDQTELITHEVRRGETLFSIARRYGQNVPALMAANGLDTPKLRVGQVLKIWVDALRGTLR